jgi:hypothetical protein
MTVKIHGKEYKTVAERVNEIHENEKDKPLSIETELISWENSVVVFKATVTTSQGVFTGHAYESEDSSQINKTSALENCETSAIGRGLASAGLAGSQFASANEVQNAIHQQSETSTMISKVKFEERLKDAESKFEEQGRHPEFCAYLEKTWGTNNIDQLAKDRHKVADGVIETLTELYKKGKK